MDTARGGLVMMPSAPLPLIPDGDEARRWAEQELSDPIYHAAEPTPFDRFARSVGDVIGSLLSGQLPPALTPWLAVVVIVVLLAAAGLAFLIWGPPRRSPRAARSVELFGDDDGRPARLLRADAEAAATREEWDLAVILRFRAIARGLVERTVLDPEPGTTVHRFAREAAHAFPAERTGLHSAADLFDDARYLHRPVGEASYRQVAELDARLVDMTPLFAGRDAESAVAGMPA